MPELTAQGQLRLNEHLRFAEGGLHSSGIANNDPVFTEANRDPLVPKFSSVSSCGDGEGVGTLAPSSRIPRAFLPGNQGGQH